MDSSDDRRLADRRARLTEREDGHQQRPRVAKAAVALGVVDPVAITANEFVDADGSVNRRGRAGFVSEVMTVPVIGIAIES